MATEKEYTLKELKKKLTEKEKNFCHEYVVDWNGARAAREAGYSEKTCTEIASQNLIKLHIEQYINFIKNDYEMLCGISKTKQLNELYKIAYSTIAHLHNTWIELKEFEELTDDQKASIESIDTKVIKKSISEFDKEKKDIVSVPVDVEYVKIKLYSKTQALDLINKMLGYNEAEKHTHEITKLTGITFDE
jgi:phage terminase small subunit